MKSNRSITLKMGYGAAPPAVAVVHAHRWVSSFDDPPDRPHEREPTNWRDDDRFDKVISDLSMTHHRGLHCCATGSFVSQVMYNVANCFHRSTRR
jgi:hypothetical protein